MTTKLSIAIDLDLLDALVREYIAEHDEVSSDDDLYRRILLSTFILWVQRRQQQPADNNVLTFRIEKEGAGNVSSHTNRT